MPPPLKSGYRCACAALLLALTDLASAAAPAGPALVRHGVTLNGAATIEGSVQQMTGESVVLNGGASISGDLFVPGTPSVRLNGHPNFGGTVVGSGSAQPSAYQIILNGNARLGNLRTRTDAAGLESVPPPPLPVGVRSVTITAAGQDPGDFATLRNLTVNGNAGHVTVPPGTYGNLTANCGSGFTLGVPGGAVPSVYNLQRLTLNGQCQLIVVGPVIINLANGFTANGVLRQT